VYKNFLRNLHLHVLDMQKVGRDAHEVDKARSLVFVVHLMGIIDVLRHVKDASISEQTVNTLLWENELAAGGFVALLLQLADDLRSGDVSRKLPPALGSLLGKPALEFLSSNIANLKRGRLQLIREHAEVPLALPSDLRITRAERLRFPFVEGETAAAETERAINFALSGVADMAALIGQNYKARRAAQNGPRTRVITAMEGCLDLLQLRGDDSNARAYLGAATGHLRVLSKWARKSTSTVNVPGFAAHVEHRGGITLPGDDVMDGELEALASRLRAADAVPPYRAKWSAASSSTVIMADVFRYQKFYEVCPNFLYLYQHCALKSVPEAVVEGMGGVWDRCATPERHLTFEAGVKEAVICWNAPKPHMESCIPFLDRALLVHFDGKPPHFTHVDAAASRRVVHSKVVQKHRNAKPRLPGSLWETSTQ